MTRKFFALFLVVLLTAAFVTAAFALPGDGNGRKGKFLYRKHCRSCHGVTASDLSPASLKQAEWEQMFSKYKETVPCYPEWKDSVSEKDLNDIYTYLYEYAKDSPTPATCS